MDLNKFTERELTILRYIICRFDITEFDDVDISQKDLDVIEAKIFDEIGDTILEGGD